MFFGHLHKIARNLFGRCFHTFAHPPTNGIRKAAYKVIKQKILRHRGVKVVDMKLKNLAQMALEITHKKLAAVAYQHADFLFAVAHVPQNVRKLSFKVIVRTRKRAGVVLENMREKLKNEKNIALEDRLWRSYGTLKYARSVTSQEAKTLISDVILGVNLGIIKKDDANFIELMIETEPSVLSKKAGVNLKPEERDIKRAENLRAFM